MSSSESPVKPTRSVFVRLLPMTAGTLFIASINPCFAHGGEVPYMPHVVDFSAAHFSRGNLNHLHSSAFQSVAPTITQSQFRPVVLNLPPLAHAIGGGDYSLDLSSASATVALGTSSFGAANSVTIQVGGASQTFRPGQLVTAGEFVAVQQVLLHSPQTITLDSKGTASGGSFSLNQIVNAKVGELLIPTNVIAVDTLSSAKSLSVGGDLINYGSIDAISTSSRVHAGSISALDIINEVGATISTNLAGTSLPSTPGAQKQVDLTLTAGNSLTNSGTIASSGALTLVSQSGALSNSGSINASHDVTIVAGNGVVTNTGSIQSAQGNVNLSTAPGTDLNVIASGGTFSALQGNINLRDSSYNGANNTNLEGGNYLSNNLNIYAGTGNIVGDVDQVTGKLNTSGDAAHFAASTETLTLGSNCLKGDPTFVNNTGNILINGGVVAAADITILAFGNITGTGNAFISTANANLGTSTPPPTNVTLVAGAVISFTSTTTTLPNGTPIPNGFSAQINFNNVQNGGNIDFSKSTHQGAIIDTSSTLDVSSGTSQVNGGNVFLTAIASGAHLGTTGQILFPTKVQSINASSEFGNGGFVSIIASNVAPKATTPSISVNNINVQTSAAQGVGTSGGVTILSGVPATNDGNPITWDSTGALTSGNHITLGLGGSVAGVIQLTGGISAGTGNVEIATGTNFGGFGGIVQVGTGRVQGGAEQFFSGSLGIGTKSANILTAASGSVDLQASGGSVFVNNLGAITLTSGTAGNGGTFQVLTTADSNGSGSITLNIATNIAAASGTLALINLNSTEAIPINGLGGISNINTGILTATTITLADGVKGAGNGSIGAATQAVNLSANCAGSVNINNNGAVNLLASSAGNDQSFSLATTANGIPDSASITLSGAIKSATGLLAQITLNSSEDSSRVTGSGIIQKTVGLSANTVTLEDTTVGGSTGGGTANLGTATKPITVFAGELIANTAGTLVNLKDTSAGGVSLAGTSGGAFSFAGAGSVSPSNITAPTAITVLAGGSAGSILLNAQVGSTTVTTGTITLTAAGKGGIQSIFGNPVVASAVILNAASGTAGTDISPLIVNTTTLQSNVTGFTSIYNQTGASGTTPISLTATKATNQFTLTSDTPIVINVTGGKPTLTGATSITLATTAAGTVGTSITYANSLGSTKTQSIAITAEANGQVGPIATTDILTASNLVSLSSGGGNIGNFIPPTPIPVQITAPNVSLNAPINGANNAVLANIIGTANTNLLNSSGGTAFTVSSNASLTLSNISLQTGFLQINCNGALLQTAPNSVISLGSAAVPAASGQITLLDTNTSKGSIFIGANTQVLTKVVNPQPGQDGSIAVAIGNGATSVNGALPTNVVVGANTGGLVFFGVNGIVANLPNNTINLKGANVAFDTNGQPANRITLGGGTTFTADPPVSAGALAAAFIQPTPPLSTTPITIQPVAAPTLSFGAGAPGLNALAATGSGAATLPAYTAGASAGANSATASGSAINYGLSNGSLSAVSGLAAALATVQNTFNTSAGLQTAWSTETELTNGEIPAVILSDDDLGIASEQSSIVEFDHGSVAHPGSQPLSGSISKVVASGRITNCTKSVDFKRGAAVVAPSVDTIINTTLGQIKVAAKSVALVIAFDGGLSVFNLDDGRKDSVQILAVGKALSLSPGQHATICSESVRDFSDINPAQRIGHRRLTSQNLGGGIKAFSSEFSVTHAMFAVQPLKHLLVAQNGHAQAIARHMLKTVSILMQLSGNGPQYEHVLRSNKIAWHQ